ncbi:MAG: hypothetical protein GY782_01395, partial [Gammaproteobacteria bacterium]|nr:hypothetical protein [Gammaproteobacteria bacterium]
MNNLKFLLPILFVLLAVPTGLYAQTGGSSSATGIIAPTSSGGGGGGMSDLIDDTTPQLGGDLDTNSMSIFWSKGADVASATELLVLTDGNSFDVTGTTAITSIEESADAFGVGSIIMLEFDGILTLTHNASDLVLPGGANITTAAGDTAFFQKYASGDWRCVNYQILADVPGAGGGDVTAASNLGDNLLIRGDGAVKGVQNSGITVDDSDNITGLGDLTGTSGQMTLTGGTASGDDILITSTSNATKGYIGLGSLTAGLVYDETNHRFSMGVDEFETTIAGFAVGSKLTTHTEGAADALDIMQHRHSDVGILGTAQAFARSRGTEASETAVQDGDSLAKLLIYGHDGTDYEAGASIEFEVDGTVAAGAMGTAMFFSTTPDGAAAVVERVRIDQAGNLGIGEAAPLNLLHIGGVFSDNIYGSGGETGSNYSMLWGGAAGAARWGLRVATSAASEDLYLDGNLTGTPANIMTWAKDTGNVGIGVTSPSTILHVDSNDANTVAIQTIENTAGDFQIFRSDATPESAITGSIGDLCVDSTNGDLYVKESGSATNTGWHGVHSSTGGSGLNTALSNPDAPIEISASNNDAGTGNTYFGASAGSNIISGGNYNTFFGLSSGN